MDEADIRLLAHVLRVLARKELPRAPGESVTNFSRQKAALYIRAVEAHPELPLRVGVSDRRWPGQGGLYLDGDPWRDLSVFWATFERLRGDQTALREDG